MSSRLIRALQRGGCTLEVRDDQWGVWRGQDRRGRMIGTLSGADIEMMRLRKDLSQLGNKDTPVFIWTGPDTRPEEVSPNSGALNSEATDLPNRSLLDRVLRTVHSSSVRRWLAKAAQAYRDDIELASLSGASPGMNWRSLLAGTRVEGGQVSNGAQSSKDAAQAKARTRKIAVILSEADLIFLNWMVLREEKATAFAKRFDLRRMLVEQKGLALLRRLAEFYDTTLTRS